MVQSLEYSIMSTGVIPMCWNCSGRWVLSNASIMYMLKWNTKYIYTQMHHVTTNIISKILISRWSPVLAQSGTSSIVYTGVMQAYFYHPMQLKSLQYTQYGNRMKYQLCIIAYMLGYVLPGKYCVLPDNSVTHPNLVGWRQRHG